MTNTKAERGKLFTIDDRHSVNSRKSDHCSWSKWCLFAFGHLGDLLGESERGEAWRNFSKTELGLAYEEDLTAREAAFLIAQIPVTTQAT